MVTETLKVTGMHCPKCVARVEKAVGALEGVEAVKADYEADTVEMTYSGEAAVMEAAKQAIAELEFVVEG